MAGGELKREDVMDGTKSEAVKSAFHELEMPDAEELMVKSRLLWFVAEEIRRRQLTQKEAGELLGLDQPNVSALVNEKLSRFSVQKLMSLVGRLGFNVSIHVEGSGIAFDVPYRSAA
jgi:predicted XRE-type DNA-binding protein